MCDSESKRSKLLEIRDPHSLKAIAYYKDPKHQTNPQIRALLVEVLGKVSSGAAVELMADAALTDPNEDVRWEAIQILAERKDGVAVRHFIERLGGKSNNDVRNRAGYALGYMNDESAIGPLIEALISTEKPYQNRPVLDALRKLTGGADFAYNVEQWRAWYAVQERAKSRTIRQEK
jgi:HEAT repeat protein